MFGRTRSITPAEAAAGLARGDLQLVDVREPGEVASASVAGAVNIPLGALPGRLSELDRTRPVAFLCRSGGRSGSATRLAARDGLDAVNVRGGIIGWSRADLPLTSNPHRGGT